MPFIPLHEILPDLAERETRTVITLNSDDRLPAGGYTLMEMYCDEPGCDCRRVFFSVVSSVTSKIETTIAYGWESPAFYARWMGHNDPQTIRELQGPILNLGSPHSDLAPAILDLVKNVILQDERYIERLKSHYAMFRAVIDASHKKRIVNRQSKRLKLTNAQKRQRQRQRQQRRSR